MARSIEVKKPLQKTAKLLILFIFIEI